MARWICSVFSLIFAFTVVAANAAEDLGESSLLQRRPVPRPVPRPRPRPPQPRPRPRPIPPRPRPVPPRPMPPRHSLIWEGNVQPVGYERMDWYIGYTVLLEEYQNPRYPNMMMSFYPYQVCNRPERPGACPPNRNLPASVLEVNQYYQNSCSSDVFEAADFGSYRDPISHAWITDNSYSRCPREQADLMIHVRYNNGFEEDLVGERTDY